MSSPRRLPIFLLCAMVLGFATSDPAPVRSGPNMHQVRSGHTATLLPDGEVLIAGGMVRNGEFLDSAETYFPQTNTFVPVGKMAAARVGHAAAALKDGRVLIVGGWGLSRAPIDSAELFDPNSRRFEPIGHMTIRRAGARATVLSDGRVLVTGGEGLHGMEASAEIFDPRTRSFQSTGKMSEPRGYHTATLLADGRVLVAGGALNWQQPVASADVFDPATGKFTSVSPMHFVRYKHAAVLLRDGRVLIAGGSDGRDWQGEYSSAELFDPARNTFQQTGSMTRARFKLNAAVLLPDGRAFVGGGDEGADVYDPTTGKFTYIPAGAETKRYFASITALKDGTVLMAGGYPRASDAPTAATWIFAPR
jgi:Galactose oxidase, central domain